MNKSYCPSCYSATEYLSSPPNFCSKCGQPFKDTFKTSIANESQKSNSIINSPQKSKPQIIIETDEDENVSVPNLTKIEVIIDEELRPNRHKIESLAGTRKTEPQPLKNTNNKKAKPLSKKEAERIWSESFPKSAKNSPTELGGE